MTQKYYHNDYKKILGVDETRTASQKILDKVVGGFRTKPEVQQERVPEKKVKQEHLALTHFEVLTKLVKNIDSNNKASKLVKPFGILRKCLGDKAFVLSPEVNSEAQWTGLLMQLIAVDERVVGNYSQLCTLNDEFVEILTLLLTTFRSNEGRIQTVKREQSSEGEIKVESVPIKQTSCIEICQLHISYCKLLTDDNFSFTKELAIFKKQVFSFFQDRLQNPSSNSNGCPQLLNCMQNILLRMFKLPHQKYEWVRSALAHFFKEFNISFKQLLSPSMASEYLMQYNAFVNAKGSRGHGQDVNFLGEGSKGGKYTQLEVIKGDGFDKWTSKQ